MGDYAKRYTEEEVDDAEARLRDLFESVGFDEAIRLTAEAKLNLEREVMWLYDTFAHPKDEQRTHRLGAGCQ